MEKIETPMDNDYEILEETTKGGIHPKNSPINLTASAVTKRTIDLEERSLGLFSSNLFVGSFIYL